jgi:hypothetical protein
MDVYDRISIGESDIEQGAKMSETEILEPRGKKVI